MYRSAVALLLAFFLMLIVIVLASQSMLVIQRIAHVDSVQGKVECQERRASPWQPLRQGMLVKAGTQIRSAADGAALLTWADGAKVKVGPDTLLSVEKCYAKSGTDEEVSLFRLHRGRVWTRIAKRLGEGAQFEVATPIAVAGVRGTVFGVETQGRAQSAVSVYEGTVELTTAQGNKVVANGTVATVTPAGQVQVRQQSPEELRQWRAREDILLPVLELTTPREGEPLRGDSVSVAGRVEPGARLTVNGVAVAHAPSGRFRTTCKPQPQQSKITVTAEDRAGRRTVRELPLLRDSRR